MTDLVHIEPGRWVLSWEQHCHDDQHSVADNALRLRWPGAGWEHLEADQIFAIHQVERVAPKTYWWLLRNPKIAPLEMRGHRSRVLASGSSKAEIEALRDKLLRIGHRTETDIQREAARLVDAFAQQARAKALDELHAALPHIFGRTA